MRLTEPALFKSAQILLRFDPDVGRRNENPKWSHKLTVRKRLISAARRYRSHRRDVDRASAPIDIDESVSDKIYGAGPIDALRTAKIRRRLGHA